MPLLRHMSKNINLHNVDSKTFRLTKKKTKKKHLCSKIVLTILFSDYCLCMLHDVLSLSFIGHLDVVIEFQRKPQLTIDNCTLFFVGHWLKSSIPLSA